MILKYSATDPQQIIASTTAAPTTNPLTSICSFRLRTATTLTPDNLYADIQDTPVGVVCDSPVNSGEIHYVDQISIHNNDTVTQTLEVRWTDGTNFASLWEGDMAAGSSLHYNEGSGWTYQPLEPQGYAINVQALTSSPTDAQTVYFGAMPKAPITTANVSKVYIRKAGVLKIAEIYCYSGTAGTAENWSLYVRHNNTTDYLIATLGVSASERVFSNTALSITVNVGDYIEIKGIQPTWGTNPLTTIYGGYIYIE